MTINRRTKEQRQADRTKLLETIRDCPGSSTKELAELVGRPNRAGVLDDLYTLKVRSIGRNSEGTLTWEVIPPRVRKPVATNGHSEVTQDQAFANHAAKTEPAAVTEAIAMLTLIKAGILRVEVVSK